jgi:WD40 repeat protein
VGFVLACACTPRPLTPAGDAGSDGASIVPPNPVSVPSSADGGVTGVVDPPPPAALCPPVDEPVPAEPSLAPAAFPPTRPPFSCHPMPGAFFFPPPGPDVPGRFSRCASFDVGAVKQLAVSPDGRLVALAPADGVVRVVEVASRQVVAVLARARATIDFVAFEPSGRGILTLASGEREVTLWRALDWTPVWTTVLEGARYQLRFGGGVAFAPDGRAAVVSTGDATFLLDVASGLVRFARKAPGAVLDVAYGWDGRRIVVAEASLIAHCVPHPNGGTVTVLDGATLAGIAQVADLPTYGSPGSGGIPAFRASPVDDLVLVVPRADEPPGLHAFRLSDGNPLPAPALAKLPAAFMPDGASVLLNEGGALRRLRLADGADIAITMLGDIGPVAVSGDGGSVAFGGSGAQLLRVWNTSDVVPETVCAGEPPTTPGYQQKPAAISRDGQVLALAAGTGIRVLRRADGSPIITSPMPGSPVLSPSGQILVTAPTLPTPPARVSRAGDGVRLAELPGDEWWWMSFAFSSREDRLYSTGFRSGTYGLAAVDLTEPAGAAPVSAVPAYSLTIGSSNGCPVLFEPGRGAWRRCGSCDDTPFLPGESTASGAVLSADGRFVAVRQGDDGVTVGEMPPVARRLASVRPRGGDPVWPPHEFPVAIASGGARLLTGVSPERSCYGGPQLESVLRQVATGDVLDLLPPGPVVADGDLRTLAYGAQLWCAR